MQTVHQRGMMQNEDIHFGIQSNLNTTIFDISTQGLILKKVHANRLVTFCIFDTIIIYVYLNWSSLWAHPLNTMMCKGYMSRINDILNKCATVTNECKTIGIKKATKPRRTPKPIKIAANKMAKAHKAIKLNRMTGEANSLKDKFISTRKKLQTSCKEV